MATLVEGKRPAEPARMPPVVVVNIIWNIAVVIGSLLLAWNLFQGTYPFFEDLGRPVEIFVSAVGLLPGLLAIYSIINMALRRPGGRFAAIIIDYVIAVLGGFALFSLWGIFLGLDNISPAILDNAQWLWGVAGGYALYWIGGRLPADSPAQIWVERAGVGLAMLALIILLWTGGILDAASAILSTYANLETWVVTAVVIFSGLLAFFMIRTGDYFDETPEQQATWQGWLMLSPNIIGFMIFFAGPLLLSFYLSFTNDTVGRVPEFTGLENYLTILSLEIAPMDTPEANPQDFLSFGYASLAEFNLFGTHYVLGARDTLFWLSLRNTILFCLMLVPLSSIPALALALILNSKLPGMKIYRAVYFVPSIAAVVGTALIWRWLYDPTIGYINYTITQIVNFLNSTFGLSLTDPRIEWLTGQGIVLFSIVILAAWQVVGFNTVLFLAGLQGIPKILYEAAYVDGANAWQRFRNVTLPLLGPTTFFVIITTVIQGLQVFNEPYALIPSRPLPIDATTSVYYLYTRGFFRFEFGYASSVAWILFGLIFLVTLVQFRLQRSRAYED